MLRDVRAAVESQAHSRPAVLVFDRFHAFLAQNFVDEDLFRMAGVGHTMIADENDVDDICQVSSD